jgi:small subunit ribosomal protein S16
VATKIKLMRLGKMRAPYYRIVVADARTKRDGRSIETIGKYHPKEDPSFIEVDSERAQYWLGVGAQPTEAVAAIFRVTGDWQKFKGEAAPPPMLVKAPKADKKVAFQARRPTAPPRRGSAPRRKRRTARRRPKPRPPKPRPPKLPPPLPMPPLLRTPRCWRQRWSTSSGASSTTQTMSWSTSSPAVAAAPSRFGCIRTISGR